MPFGLNESDTRRICDVFAEHAKIDKVVIYGSHAMETHRPSSDIDLAFFGAELTESDMSEVAEDLDNLLLPYSFDITLFAQIDNKDLLARIERAGKIFFRVNQ
jgi:predicted nucleotidyltransferase